MDDNKISKKVDITAYVSVNPGNKSSGWITVKTEKGLFPEIPQGTKVRITGEGEGRLYFTILEGAYQGTKASLTMRTDFNNTLHSYFNTLSFRRPAARITYNQSKEELNIDKLGVFKATSRDTRLGILSYVFKVDPIPVGEYKLQIPDIEHQDGAGYLGRTRYVTTWFHIVTHDGFQGRYLHCGRISHGCITVLDVDKWTKICTYLLDCRDGTGNIGTVIVKDH